MNFFARLKDTRITKSDLFYLLGKASLSVLFCFGFGIILGVILIVVANFVLDKVVQRIYGVVPLNS